MPPLWILCVTTPAICLKPERTRLITNKSFTEKLFPYLKFTHVLLIYIYSTLFTVIFVIYITFKRYYLSRVNNSASNYYHRLKYTSWLFCVFILTSVTASIIPQQIYLSRYFLKSTNSFLGNYCVYLKFPFWLSPGILLISRLHKIQITQELSYMFWPINCYPMIYCNY